MTHSHTPGPWEVSKHGTPESHPQYGIYAGSKNDHVIVKGDNATTDARLIAAAPELLEALKLVVSSLDYWFKRYDDPEGAKSEMMNRARAAIAKATGETK